MGNPTVSDVLVDGLARQGVRHVFGVVGDALNTFTDAIRRHDGIDWIGTRHEEVAAFAAGAQAQLTGKLGVCAGTVGPGSIHLLNGLYDAAKSHAPVLAVTGQVPRHVLGTNYFQEIDNDAVFRDVAVFNRTIVSPEQIPVLIELALESALGERGVAVLTLPVDIGSSEVSDDSRPVRVFVDPSGSRPGDDHLAEAARVVNRGGKVTLLVGIGARDARAEVLELSRVLAAPMVVTLKAKEAFDWDNPAQVGQSGLLGNPAAAQALEDCDVLILVATDFPYPEFYPEGKRTVQIDAVAPQLGRRTAVDVGLVGDARLTLQAWLPRLQPITDGAHLDAARSAYERWQARQRRFTDPSFDRSLRGRVVATLDNRSHRIRPEAVAAAIDRLADDDAVFTADTGMSTVWLARFVSMRQHQRLLGSFNLGSMANAMPQAIGAQAADQSRQVIAFVGDGGFTMLLGDLLTAVAHQLPIKVIVFDNERLGMVKLEQEEAGLPEFGTQLRNPDLAAVARAMGATGIRVDDPDEVEAAVARALSTPGPVVVDALTNPEEVALPPRTEPRQAWGFAVAKLKEAIRSRGDDAEERQA
ncbi:MAG: thiamine pyrophosphate protein binding domain protein [Acidimicrobiales bacterium]|nr:thiamine pyrophosphate protein binding domain protein [Acidimicrobiales bacterium]